MLLLPTVLAPGRYTGASGQGAIELQLKAGGQARFGGQIYQWSQSKGQLTLKNEDRTLALTIESTAKGPCLVGPPFGRVYLNPAPNLKPKTATRTSFERPSGWIGTWTHRASGGQVALTLAQSGTYTLVQTVAGGAATAEGTWSAEGETLLLKATTDAALRYRIRHTPTTLYVSGGALPFEVPFHRVFRDPPPSL